MDCYMSYEFMTRWQLTNKVLTDRPLGESETDRFIYAEDTVVNEQQCIAARRCLPQRWWCMYVRRTGNRICIALAPVTGGGCSGGGMARTSRPVPVRPCLRQNKSHASCSTVQDCGSASASDWHGATDASRSCPLPAVVRCHLLRCVHGTATSSPG
jgi:hypothetical protein